MSTDKEKAPWESTEVELPPWEAKRSPDIISGATVGEEVVPQWEAGVRGAGQGLSFGFSDEIQAAVKRLAGGDYDKLLDEVRSRENTARAVHPLTYTGAELTGSLATSAIPVIGVAGKGASLARAAGQSALGSAISGAGSADGDIQDRLSSALTSGALGGVLGGAGQKLAKSAKSAAGTVAEVATGATGREQQKKFAVGSGEKLLKEGLVKFGDTPRSIAEKAKKALSETSEDIGKSLKGIAAPTKEMVVSNIEKEKVLLDPIADESVIKRLDRYIKTISNSADDVSSQQTWNRKKKFDSKVNWKTWQDKPDQAQADFILSKANRNAVEQQASAIPELAKKFSDERKMFSFLKPIKEASERAAATAQQRAVGGALDTITGLGTAGYGVSQGQSIPESLAMGAGAALGRRVIQPRIASSVAATLDSNALNKGLRYGGITTGKELGPSLWDAIKYRSE